MGSILEMISFYKSKLSSQKMKSFGDKGKICTKKKLGQFSYSISQKSYIYIHRT